MSSVEDSFFDWRHGIETSQAVNTDELEATLRNRPHAARYRATRARAFRDLLNKLALPENSTFVDVGSGKGRVLLLAAQHPFARVVGIEFSPMLCERARRNIDIFRAKTPALAPIDVCQEDVTQYTFRGDENVFFLYNPFDAAILNQFVENVRRSLAEHPRPIWLIYSVPLHAAVLEASGVFTRSDTFCVGGNDVYVYSNEDQPGLVAGSPIPEISGIRNENRHESSPCRDHPIRTA